MPRFSNLELGDEFHQEATQKAPAPVEQRDEGFYLAQALEHWQNARFDQAMRLYSRALEFDPNLADGWSGQARMLIELGEYKEALLWADKALEVFPDNSDLLAAKAVAYVRLGSRKKALEFSDASIEKRFATVYGWLARGEVMLGTKGWNDEYCFLRAISSAGRDWFIRLLIARIYFFYSRYSQALVYARQALELHPTSPFVWHVIANSQMELGFRGEARRSYQEALKLNAQFLPAQMGLTNLENSSLISILLSPLQWLLFRPLRWLLFLPLRLISWPLRRLFRR
ncbi:MAG: tetratricopeptide repeat protein [Candidatus Sumerlaeota bacterium]|nr:tetratricopeptide repeat protein [Candidatus Sumerlaeota bacterium]